MGKSGEGKVVSGERIAALRKSFKGAGIDAYVVNNKYALRYLFGFSGSMAVAVVTHKKLHFFTNDLYDLQVRTELHKLDGLQIHIDRNMWGKAAQIGAFKNAKAVGFVPTETTVSTLKSIKKAAGSAKLVEVSDLATPITQHKLKSEVSSIAKAAQIASTAYEKLLGVVKSGMREHEVASFLSRTMRDLGSEKEAFDIIVVAGERSAMPHGRASQKKIKKGDVVTVDFGAMVDGFCSDMTRVFSVGAPSKKVVDVFAVLFDAHLSALDSVKAGMKASDLDASARSIIQKAGYGENFRHALGHGLGYEVHEEPRISYSNANGIVPEGCVVAIEPGIYLPGKFGMRIEDDVHVRAKGSEILTSAPRELVVV